MAPGPLFEQTLAPLTDEQVDELSRRYWHTPDTRAVIERSLGITSFQCSRNLRAMPTGEHCPHCGGELTWKNRQDRKRQIARCAQCRHQSGGSCRCEPCADEREREYEAYEAEAQALLDAALRNWEAEFSHRYVARVITELTPPQRLFLDGLRRHWNDKGLSAEDIAVRVGLQPHRTDGWLLRFGALGLTMRHEQRLYLHPAISSSESVLSW